MPRPPLPRSPSPPPAVPSPAPAASPPEVAATVPPLPRPLPPRTPGEWVSALAGALGVPAWRVVAAAALALAVVVGALLAAAGRLPGGPPPELRMPRAGGPGDPATTTTTAAPTVLVHVAGAVAMPGVYEVGEGARVKDVLDAAGGPAPDADLDRLNLAAAVSDGQQIYVLRRGEAGPPASAALSGAAASGPAPPLDLNAATAEQLEELPGVGPSTAEAIVAYRTEHGRFRSVEQLLEVRGIGEAKLAAIRKRVRV